MLTALRPIRRSKAPVYTVAISRDGARYLWAGGRPGEACPISVCDTASDKVLHTLMGHKKPVVSARFLEDDSVVSFSFDAHVCRWTPTGELAVSNETHLEHRADGFAVSSDGKLAVIGDYRGEISGWRLDDGSKAFAFKDNSRGSQLWAVALEPNGKRLLSGGAEGKIHAWTVANQRQHSEIDLGRGNHIQGLAWHPNGKTFAAAVAPDGTAPEGSKSRVVVLDGASGKELTALSTDGHKPLCCAFSRDGKLFAAAGGGTDRSRESKANCVIHLWKTAKWQTLPGLTGHTGLVRDLAFTPDSRWLLSAGWDNTVRAWRLDEPA